MLRPRSSPRELLVRALHRGYRSRYDALHVLVTALAGGAAWFLASVFDSAAPILTAMAAVVTVQSSVHSSLADGFKMVVATAAGALVALLLLQAVEPSPFSVILLVVLCLLVGRLLGLGAEGSVQIPGTSLFVYSLGVHMPEGVFMSRVGDTVLGVTVGVIASFAAHPQPPEERAKRKIEEISLAISRLLGDLAGAVSTPVAPDRAASYLAQSRKLRALSDEAAPLVAEVQAKARWGGKKRAAEADELSLSLRSIDHAIAQVNGIARNLFDATKSGDTPVLPGAISQVLEHTADAFAVHAEEISGAHAALHEALDEVRDVRQQSLTTLRDVDDTGVWLLSGAILADVDKMVDQLEGSAPALDVTTTGEHTVLPVMRVALHDSLTPKGRRLWRRRRKADTGPLPTR